METIGAAATARNREEAAFALAELLGVDTRVADQVLDLHVSDFVGELRGKS
jgi:hypothetical protein